MAKQTFTTGQVLTAANMTQLQQLAMLGGAASAKVASYVLTSADAGDAITMSNASPTTITVNTGLFAEGDIVTIINLSTGTCTITAGSATVTTSGSLVLSQNQGGVLRFTSASAAIFFQFATPASGDIEGVTAGTGISGGGTSGTVTITNSMATEITAKGDLIVGTGSGTFDNLPVGANDTTLVADSSTSTGLKWAAAASSGALTLISSTSVGSGVASVTISSAFSATYDNYLIMASGVEGSINSNAVLTFGATTTGYYWSLVKGEFASSTVTGIAGANQSSFPDALEFSTTTSNMIFRVNSPNLTENTIVSWDTVSPTTTGFMLKSGGFVNNTTSYTAFTLTCSGAATISGGTIKVYGYANS